MALTAIAVPNVQVSRPFLLFFSIFFRVFICFYFFILIFVFADGDRSAQRAGESPPRRVSHSTHSPHMSEPILPIFQNLIRVF